MTQLTWLSHGTWLIRHANYRVLLDPFFTGNPAATSKPADFDDVTHILVSHGHADHVGDLVEVAQRSGAMVVASFEITQWLGGHGIENTEPMNVGGAVELSLGGDVAGSIRMVPAIHSSSFDDGSYAGPASGFVLTLGDKRIYFACDTAYFSDMRYYAAGVDVAVLPIGDRFTMGIDDSIAAAKLIEPKALLPAHYNTWPLIAQDAEAWAKRVSEETSSQARALQVGETFEL